MRHWLPIFLLIVPVWAWGQQMQPMSSTTDTVILSYEEFIDQVLKNHPMTTQADITNNIGDAKFRASRGNFDPRLVGGYGQKSFDGKNYFRTFNSSISLPTRLGVSFNAGYEQANGEFLNPELTTPDAGLLSVGAEVNLGKGLLIDERRKEFQQARIYARSTREQRRIMMNELIFRAGEHYWNWVAAYNKMRIYRQATELARIRFEGVVSGFQQGDRPAIDTTEALIQVQNRQFFLNESLIKLNEARMKLSNFLWNEEGEPLELVETVEAPSPETLTEYDMQLPVATISDFDSLFMGHPVIRYYNYQIEGLEVERRYKAELLKPKVALKYNYLSGAEAGLAPTDWQSYKVGAEVSFPLLIRKERGDLAAVKLQKQDAELQLERKRWEISNKLTALQIKIALTTDQIELYTDAVANYQRLLDGETMRFTSGESSLFMVNSREQSLIKAQLQLLDQLTMKPILIAELRAVAGGPTEE